MQQAELKKIIEAHAEWLRGEPNGRRADLSSADLRSADLRSADLSSANLRSADLRSADLSSADLRSADLRSANLRSADLRSAAGFDPNNHRNVFWIIPEVGSFRCFKKLQNQLIAELEVPAEALRVCNIKNPRKFRVEYAKVVNITRGQENFTRGESLRGNLTYVCGEVARPDSFDDSMTEDCSNGIHAFITRQEAEEWN